MDLLLLTQYFDMLNVVGQNPSTNSVFVPHKLGGVGAENMGDLVRDGVLQAGASKSAGGGMKR